MPRIHVEIEIDAPIQRVFDLSRSVDLHLHAAAETGERAIAGVTQGLLNLGDRVTWEATHFGVRQTLTVEITSFDAPHSFRDSMVDGIFVRFDHDHVFETTSRGGTIVRECFDYVSPWGVLGRLANVVVVHRHLSRFLQRRLGVIKKIAESDEWSAFVGDA